MKNLIYEDGIIIHPTTIYAFFSVSPLMILSILALFAAPFIHPYFVFISILFVFMAWIRFLTIKKITYIISNQTIRVQTGLFSRRMDSLELFRVRDFVIKQSFAMRLFDIMSLTLTTTDHTNPTLTLTGIQVSNISEILRENVQKARILNRNFEIN